jgi:hypothetical protein
MNHHKLEKVRAHIVGFRPIQRGTQKNQVNQTSEGENTLMASVGSLSLQWVVLGLALIHKMAIFFEA